MVRHLTRLAPVAAAGLTLAAGLGVALSAGLPPPSRREKARPSSARRPATLFLAFLRVLLQPPRRK